MHRPGRIGRDIFDIDLFGRAYSAAAIGIALAQDGAQRGRPDVRFQGQIDEAGTGDVDLLDQIVSAQFCCDLLGKIARFCPGILRQHHRGIGRHIAMGSIARRFDHHAREVDIRPAVVCRKRRASGMDACEHIGEKMLGGSRTGHVLGQNRDCAGLASMCRRLTQIRGRVKKPLVLGQ
jgi:hypothetical protein